MKRYSEEELRSLWREWYADPENKEKASKLLAAFDPIIDVVIRTYVGETYIRDPLMRGRAKNILMNAFKNYDETRGSIVNFSWIYLQRLQRMITKHQNTISTSEQKVMTLRELEKVTKELQDELGRDPSDEELADRMGLSVKKILKLRSTPLYAFESSASQKEESQPFFSSVASKNNSEEILNFLYDSLDNNVDKYILEHAYGLNGKKVKTSKDIAASLKLSSSTIAKKLQELNQKAYELSMTLR
ncbi:MAG: sigma-70 domain-containing protein [Nitrososphaerota archaeon]